MLRRRTLLELCEPEPYRRNLNTHVVDDVLWLRPAKGLAERNISGGHHLILSFEWGGVTARLRYKMRTLTNYYTAAEREGIGAQTACAHQGTCLGTGVGNDGSLGRQPN